MRMFSFLVVIGVIMCTGCFVGGERVNGNGKMASEERNVGNASKIRVRGSMDVVLIPGSSALKVEAEENIIPYIETTRENGWLTIGYRRNVNISTHEPVRVYITKSLLRSLRLEGSGNVVGKEKFSSGENLDLDISGSGDMSIKVNSPRVNAELSGSGNLNIEGETRDVSVRLTGSCNYKGAALKAENANVTITGSGDAEVFADVHLRVKVTGSGSVRYKGNAHVDKNITGSGSVDRKN